MLIGAGIAAILGTAAVAQVSASAPQLVSTPQPAYRQPLSDADVDWIEAVANDESPD